MFGKFFQGKKDSPTPTFYCTVEREYLPRSEFEFTQDWGWVHVQSKYEPHNEYGTFIHETFVMEGLIP